MCSSDLDPASGYSFVWHIEIGLLFATLIAIGPLARRADETTRALLPLPSTPWFPQAIEKD